MRDGNFCVTSLKSLALSTQAVFPVCGFLGFSCVISTEGFLGIYILLLKNALNWTNHIF